MGRWGIVGVVVAVIAACIIILPPIRYRVFWYAISSTEIDIQNGIIFTTRSVVPMRRVQTLLIRTRTDGRPLPVDEPEDPYCGRLGAGSADWTGARLTNSAIGSAA